MILSCFGGCFRHSLNSPYSFRNGRPRLVWARVPSQNFIPREESRRRAQDRHPYQRSMAKWPYYSDFRRSFEALGRDAGLRSLETRSAKPSIDILSVILKMSPIRQVFALSGQELTIQLAAQGACSPGPLELPRRLVWPGDGGFHRGRETCSGNTLVFRRRELCIEQFSGAPSYF